MLGSIGDGRCVEVEEGGCCIQDVRLQGYICLLRNASTDSIGAGTHGAGLVFGNAEVIYYPLLVETGQLDIPTNL